MTLYLHIENEPCLRNEDETIKLDAAGKLSPPEEHQATKIEPILCTHCLRTATNGNKCKGLCVADSDY